MKLAFADRERYYGDPLFTRVPLEALLSDQYTEERSRLVDPRRASLELRPGFVDGFPPAEAFTARDIRDVERATARPGKGDTTKLEVIDAAGTMVSATTSGGWLQSSPVIPGLGFCLGTRGQMFSLDPRHPNSLEPLKRPRTTLTPTLATREGRPYMAFGSPGGDHQDQWALQFFLNVVEFGMSLQEAVEAPTFWTTHFPSSFYPRVAEPGTMYVEGRIADSVQAELRALGHRVNEVGAWSGGNTLAASVDTVTGILAGAASPRLDPAYAAAF
jgi:gamma-glutamyltranspeptidase/glutathione hydrolase